MDKAIAEEQEFQLRFADENASTIILAGRIKQVENQSLRGRNELTIKTSDIFHSYLFEFHQAWQLNKKEVRLPLDINPAE